MVSGVRSCYDEGKRTAETLTMDYHRGAGVEVRLVVSCRKLRLHLFITMMLLYIQCSIDDDYV